MLHSQAEGGLMGIVDASLAQQFARPRTLLQHRRHHLAPKASPLGSPVRDQEPSVKVKLHNDFSGVAP